MSALGDDSNSAPEVITPQILEEADLSSWAWRQLMMLASTEYAFSVIAEDRPSAAGKYARDMRKQSHQIRHCLIQAREYFAAAKNVGIPTKPNLLYYGISSLATALVLRRGDGTHSLDFRRRQARGHHGLDITSTPSAKDLFSDTGLSTLQARVHTRKQQPHGTFADLLDFLRPDLAFCRRTINQDRSKIQNFAKWSECPSIRARDTVGDTYSLGDLAASLPDFEHKMPIGYSRTSLGTCEIRQTVSGSGKSVEVTVVINDCPPEAQDHILSQLASWSAAPVTTATNLERTEDSLIFSMQHDAPAREFAFITATHTRNGDLKPFLGREFGKPWLPPLAASFAILFMLSMLVRYYPDIWMHAVEGHAQGTLLIDDLVSTLEQEIPIMMVEQMFGTKIFRRSFTSNLL